MGKHVIELNHVIDEPRLNAGATPFVPMTSAIRAAAISPAFPACARFRQDARDHRLRRSRPRDRKARAGFRNARRLTQRTRLSEVEEGFLGATYLPLHELMARSDYLTVNLPVTPQTTGILGKAEFAALKPGAFLANVSRPELIDRAALFEALELGRLAGYGTDVWFDRPARSDDPFSITKTSSCCRIPPSPTGTMRCSISRKCS